MSQELDRSRLKKLIARKDKPEFLRHLWWKFKKFQNKLAWRRPKGNDNPMRMKEKGYPPPVSVGYRTPRIIRGLHPSGLKPVVVSSVSQLKSYSPDEVIVYISSTVGRRKKALILEEARKLGFRVANPTG